MSVARADGVARDGAVDAALARQEDAEADREALIGTVAAITR
jgi:hypothetical protein